jgi:4-hydroxy-2-oxoglutarate aldolase
MLDKIGLMIEGVFPPLPTPFHDDGSLAIDRLRANVELLGGTGLSGCLALGSNGEAFHVSPAEASQVYAAVAASVAPGMTVLAGTGQLSTWATIEMTGRAADAGCDAALVLPPFYYRGSMTEGALRKHFEAVADASRIPVLLYNVPATTGLSIPVEVIAALARHPNIVGVKDSSGEIARLAETVRLTRGGEPFSVLSGNYAATLPGLTFGIHGAILAVGNVAPRECVSLFSLFREGRTAEAGQLHLRLLPIATAVTSKYGVPGLKAALDLLGRDDDGSGGPYGGPPRPPLLPASPAAWAEIAETLREAGLLAD